MKRKAVWGSKRFARIVLSILVLAGVTTNAVAASGKHSQGNKTKPGLPSARVKQYKLDDELTRRADRDPRSTTRVIVALQPGAEMPAEFKRFGQNKRFDIINGQVLELPNNVLRRLAQHPNVFRVHYDRPIKTHNYRTSLTVGARSAIYKYGYTGKGIGIAVIDSGIASWHDDLFNFTSQSFPYGNQRVAKFVDFVNGQTLPYDDNGHGSHVSGVIGGLGLDSRFEKAGIAPLASLVSLKVLDQNGQGTVSNLIAALNWVAANHAAYNIRVVNMSVGAGVYESYWTDPLTLAAKAVTDKGITVVAAAGNLGKNAAGNLQWGGITAPGNAPWVLTVGASSSNGTSDRADDVMAGYSSSGPTAVDFGSKPDLVAPGTGTISLAAPASTFFLTKSQYLVKGTNGMFAYLSLSGTSMAAPVVSGTVALMLQANPTLTPNLIKAILQYTAQEYPGYSALRQGAGFLNTLGAVELARFYATAVPGARMPVQSTWSRKLIWGNHRLKGGYLVPGASAWGVSTVWGAAEIPAVSGSGILGGGTAAQNVVWGTNCADALCENVVWGTDEATLDNVVWGTSIEGLLGDLQNVVWGTQADSLDNVVWGTDCGGDDCDNVVWGTSIEGLLGDLSNVVWGTCDPLDNVVWGTNVDLANVVWGTSSDHDVTWGSESEDAVMYPDDATDATDATELLPSTELGGIGEIIVQGGEGTIPQGGL